MSTAAAHMVYRSTTDWSGASGTCAMLPMRSCSGVVPAPNPPTRTTPAATRAAPTRSARRSPDSTSSTQQVTAVAIHAPRLKDSASGRTSAAAHPAATVRREWLDRLGALPRTRAGRGTPLLHVLSSNAKAAFALLESTCATLGRDDGGVGVLESTCRHRLPSCQVRRGGAV